MRDSYICGSYKRRTRDCSAHYIDTNLLKAGVTANLRQITGYAAQHEVKFMQQLIRQNEDGDRKANAARQKELQTAEKRINELSAIFKRLYEDSVSCRITDERFMELSAGYEQEQAELKARAAELKSLLAKNAEAKVSAEKFMQIVRKHTNFEELTPTLLREFIDKIVVHEAEALDGKRHGKQRRQQIDIYYSFVGRVEIPSE